MRRGSGPLERALVFVTLAAFQFNDVVGSAPLYGACGLWVLYGASRSDEMLGALSSTGLFVWLFPALTLASTLWSWDPSISFRAGAQVTLTTIFAILCARAVTPRVAILLVGTVTTLVVCLSLLDNNSHFDAMTGTASWAGIFTNKNSLGTSAALMAMAGLVTTLDTRWTWPVRLAGAATAGGAIVVNLAARAVGTSACLAMAILVMCAIAIARTARPRDRGKAFMMVAGAVAILMIPVALALAFAPDDLLAFVGKDSTLTGRTYLWSYADQLVAQGPLLGRGYYAFWVQGNPEAEFLWAKMHIAARFGFHFHNIVYQNAVEMGLLGGLVVILVMLATVWRAALWNMRLPTAPSSFFLALSLYAVVFQTQSVDLFQPFNFLYVLFTIAWVYARDWKAYSAVDGETIPLPVRSTRHRLRPVGPAAPPSWQPGSSS